ncbi:hypothetical protein POD33_34990 [Streptomyces moderatus]|nr:hypothetical protein POD33_34990 [Streptomyces moderatus]
MKLTARHAHQSNGDVWNPHCRVCGVQLLDGGITPADLAARVSEAFQQVINPTGRVRGSWMEVEEVLDDECWMWWVRPASNLLGFEAVEHPSSNPTGEELSLAFLAEMLSAPEVKASPVDLPEIGTAWSRLKPTRWERAIARYRDWREASEMREFVSLAAPLVCVELFAVCWILGSDGCAAVAQALWSLVS